MLETLYLLDRTLSATHPTLDMSPPTTCTNVVHPSTVPTNTTTTTTSLPSYLQVIQLVEVPMPSAEQLKGSASYYSSSASSSSSYSSVSSSSMDVDDDSMESGSEYDSYCSTSVDDEAPTSTGGSMDVECDRVRLSRISAWMKMTTTTVDVDDCTPWDETTRWTCSGCDRGFDDRERWERHPGTISSSSEACRAVVEYALEPNSRIPT